MNIGRIERPLAGGKVQSLYENSALLDTAVKGHRVIIGTWDDIPDVLTIESAKTEWLVRGVIPTGSVVLLAGEQGSYKSWLALALLRGVTFGGQFLNRHCASNPVLYLDRENPLAVVRERLAMLGIESQGEARIWGGWLLDAPPPIGDPRLLEIARNQKPLIIFDSLIRFHMADENSATEMAGVMNHLRALSNAGATVFVLHHKSEAEGSQYRGSSDIAGAVDIAYAVSRNRAAGTLTIECFKNRFAEEFSITVRPDLSGSGDFVVTDAPEVTAENDYRKTLADTIRQNPGMTQEKVLLAAGVPKGRARAILERFNGSLWRSERGAHNAKCFFPLTVELEV